MRQGCDSIDDEHNELVGQVRRDPILSSSHHQPKELSGFPGANSQILHRNISLVYQRVCACLQRHRISWKYRLVSLISTWLLMQFRESFQHSLLFLVSNYETVGVSILPSLRLKMTPKPFGYQYQI